MKSIIFIIFCKLCKIRRILVPGILIQIIHMIIPFYALIIHIKGFPSPFTVFIFVYGISHIRRRPVRSCTFYIYKYLVIFIGIKKVRPLVLKFFVLTSVQITVLRRKIFFSVVSSESASYEVASIITTPFISSCSACLTACFKLSFRISDRIITYFK